MSIVTKYRRTRNGLKSTVNKIRESGVAVSTAHLRERVSRSGQVRCDFCDEYMNPKVALEHIERAHADGRLPTPTAEPNATRRLNTKKTKARQPTVADAVAAKSVANADNDRRRGATVMTTAQVENGHVNPAQGLGDEIARLMNEWATRLPANFKAAEREAETMAEAWRGIADAFRRRSETMVEVLGVNPAVVEPYDDAAVKASTIGDAFAEVSNRIAITYQSHIEVANDANAPVSEFLKEDG